MNAMRTFTKKLAGLAAVLVLLPGVLLLPGCTDLGEETFGVVTPDQFYQSEAEVLAALAPVYAQLRGTLWAYHNLSEISSDEVVVPTRGSDWGDAGRWLEMHQHEWGPSSPMAVEDLNAAWNDSNTGVARANALLLQLNDIDVPGKAGLVAELRALRAFYYYQLMDLFGGVPLIGDEEGEFLIEDLNNPPPRNTRAETFDFIVRELEAIRGELPTASERGAGGYGRVTQGAVDAMLANLYLNAAVFTKNSTQIAPNGYNSCMDVQIDGQNACQRAVQAADRVLNSGEYRLASNWFENFIVENQTSPEFIFVVPHENIDGLGLTFAMRGLHYNQFDPSPWNGFSTIAETYNAFDDDDVRKDIFYDGPQAVLATCGGDLFDPEPGEEGCERAQNRQGQPLTFTPDIANVANASEGEGVRIMKFEPDLNNVAGNNANDFAYFRLAEIYLVKAEALNELNGPTGEALGLLNELRERVFDPDEPLEMADASSRDAMRAMILRERLFELTYEAKRRQDLIRHGRFLDAWSFKNASQPRRLLFPIPQIQRDANPNLEQNPGY